MSVVASAMWIRSDAVQDPHTEIKLLTVSSTMVSAVLFTAIVSSAGQPEVASTDWPQWRGPTRDCQLASGVWPESVSTESLVQRWRVELGPSYSGPIVVGDRVIVTETQDRSSEVVRALDRRSGEELWRHKWAGAMSVPFFAKANGDWIRSTPASDGEHLYVAGMRDVLVALRVDTGEEVWRTDFTQEFGSDVESFGFVCSPLIDGDSVIVQCGAGTVKLNKHSGITEWRIPDSTNGMTGGAFSSPVIATIAGRRQLVVQTRAELMGVDLPSGDKLWSTKVPAYRGMNILTPLVIGDSVFTCTYGGGAAVYGIRQDGDRLSVTIAWDNNTQGYMSSPALIGGHVYVHLKNQRFSCLDPADGTERWRTTPFGKYWSMVVNGDRILALDQRGQLLLIDASPEEFRVLDQRQVSEQETWAHLAVSGDQVFVRELNGLSAFTWK